MRKKTEHGDTDEVVQIWISRQIADCFVSHGILTSGERWQVSFWNLIRKVIGKRRSKDKKLFFLKSYATDGYFWN
jgi:hypothetical protein